MAGIISDSVSVNSCLLAPDTSYKAQLDPFKGLSVPGGCWRTIASLGQEVSAALRLALSGLKVSEKVSVLEPLVAHAIENTLVFAMQLAEEVGFEPTVELPPRRFSRPLP
jgi:hypothetical protein